MLLISSGTYLRPWIPIIIIIYSVVVSLVFLLLFILQVLSYLPTFKKMLYLSVSLRKAHPPSPSLAKHIKRTSCCPYQVFSFHSSTLSVMASLLAHGNTAQGCAAYLTQLNIFSHTVSCTVFPPSRVDSWGKASFFAPSLGSWQVFARKWFLSSHSSVHMCSVITLQRNMLSSMAWDCIWSMVELRVYVCIHAHKLWVHICKSCQFISNCLTITVDSHYYWYYCSLMWHLFSATLCPH